jgi:sugar phosphate isomerase/epimerase
LGEVNFPRVISALYRNGYDHVLCIEHEDRCFEGSVEAVQRGFLLARNFLAPLVA